MSSGNVKTTTELLNDPRVQKSISALRGLGLKVQAELISEDWLMLAITEDSIITTIKRLIEKNMRYPSFIILRDRDTGLLAVHFWRGDMPLALRNKIWTTK